jgi:RNA polymerase sigma-70 factor, ECF subfamily
MTQKQPSSREPSGSGTSTTLLDKVRQNDRDAWNRLVSLYSPLVCFWCRRAGLPAPDTEDIAQEVFLAVARSIGRFHRDKEGDSFRAWLRTITDRKICDHASTRGIKAAGGSDAQRELLQVPAAHVPDDNTPDALAMERKLLFSRAVELIEGCYEESTRRAFWQLMGGRTPTEVAAELRMTRAAVYTAKSRILRRLREEFHGVLDFGDSVLEGRKDRPLPPR